MSKSKIKVLNIAQPNAHYIFNSRKNIENRSMASSIRGTIAIYASKTYDASRFEGAKVEKDDCDFGVILGFVDIVDCITKDEVKGKLGKWFIGPYGYVLENPRLLKKPILVTPPTGAIIWWDLSGAKAQECLEQVNLKTIIPLTKSDKKSKKVLNKKSARAKLIPSKNLAAIIGKSATSYRKAIDDISEYMEKQELGFDEKSQTISADKKLKSLCGKAKVSLKDIVKAVEENLEFS